MKFAEGELNEILAYIELAEDLKPVAKKAVKVLLSYGPEMREIMDAMSDYFVDRTATTIGQFIKKGFTMDQAILLTLHTKLLTKDIIDSFPKGK